MTFSHGLTFLPPWQRRHAQGLQGLGTRAAAFVAAEVRAMLQAAIQRFLLMAGDSGSPPPWPQRQPCLLQLADLEVERKDHRRALDLFCQVRPRH